MKINTILSTTRYLVNTVHKNVQRFKKVILYKPPSKNIAVPDPAGQLLVYT